MKTAKLLAMTFAAVLLAGCADDHDILSTTQAPQAIAFGADVDGGAETRGSVVNENVLKNAGFKLYANIVSGSSELTPLAKDLQISYSDSKWQYSPTLFWPTDKKESVDFFAVYSDANTTVDYAQWDKRPHISYVVPENVSEQTDFLWAAPVLGAKQSDYSTAASSNVNFRFKHALSRIDFIVKNLTDENIVAAFQNSSNFANSATAAIFADPNFHYYDLINHRLARIEVSGYFPNKGEIDPYATEIENAWKFNSDWEKHTYTMKIFEDYSKNDGFGYVVNDHGHIFVLPCGNLDFDIKLIYSFKYKGKKYEYSMTKRQNTTFDPGSSFSFEVTPTCGECLSTLKEVEPEEIYVNSITDFLDALNSGDNVKLGADVTFNGSSLVVESGRKLNIDLNGHKLSDVTVKVESGSKLTIQNGTLDYTPTDYGQAMVQIGNNKSLVEGVQTPVATNNSNVTLKNITYTSAGANDNKEVFLRVYGQDNVVNMTDCNITTNGYYCVTFNGLLGGNTLNLTNSTLVNNGSDPDNLGLYISNTRTASKQNVNISGSTITAGMPVEVKHTNLNIATGCTLTSTTAAQTWVGCSNGSTTQGFVVAVTNNGTDGSEPCTGNIILGAIGYTLAGSNTLAVYIDDTEANNGTAGHYNANISSTLPVKYRSGGLPRE